MSGVFPVYKNKIEIEISDGEFASIAGIETFSPSFDGTIEEWKDLLEEGYTSRAKTGMDVTIGFSGKRVVGDAGNDYVAGLTFKKGQDIETKVKWTMPDGTVITIPSIVNVTNNGGGEATNVGALEFDCLANGNPTVV